MRTWTEPARAAAVVALTLVAVACGSESTPTSEPVSATTPDDESATTPDDDSATTPDDDSAYETTPEMEELIAAAQEEGTVVFYGTQTPAFQAAMTEAFRNRYGVTLEYVNMSPGEFLNRVDREIRADQVSIDVFSQGSNSNIMSELDQLEDMQGWLFFPEAIDPDAWDDDPFLGHTYPLEVGGSPENTSHPDGYVARIHSALHRNAQLWCNTELVPDLESWDELLEPEFTGMLVAHTPRQGGAGQSVAASIMHAKGEEYFRDLYLGQEVVISDDHTQLVDWVVRGTALCGLGLSAATAKTYIDQGLPIDLYVPADGPDTLTGGGGISVVKNPPHPNAARLLVNWFHTREAQALYETHQEQTSMRNDTGTKDAPLPYSIPDPDTEYWFHDQLPEYHFAVRDGVVQQVIEVVGRE